jgi:hypothetical protein
VNHLPQRVLKKIKHFLIEIFLICHRCQRHRWCTLSCEYLREFPKKFETVLMVYSSVGGKIIHGKTRIRKSRDTVPLIVSVCGTIVFYSMYMKYIILLCSVHFLLSRNPFRLSIFHSVQDVVWYHQVYISTLF